MAYNNKTKTNIIKRNNYDLHMPMILYLIMKSTYYNIDNDYITNVDNGNIYNWFIE